MTTETPIVDTRAEVAKARKTIMDATLQAMTELYRKTGLVPNDVKIDIIDARTYGNDASRIVNVRLTLTIAD